MSCSYEYDKFNYRYVAGAYRSADRVHYVKITIRVDSVGRYVRGEASDVLTFL